MTKKKQKVSAAMCEAGARALYELTPDHYAWPGAVSRETVKAVYLAMAKVSSDDPVT